ncbi:MAG: MBL fold metallo-hydrolase, partial [Acidobacteria bacterium]|nr:MBL fold metallo-hydrolase [Acidobacteriota bacterium]
YLTDYNEIPESSLQLLKGVEWAFLDALRHEAHPTHMTVANAVRLAKQLQSQQAFLTHIAHDLGHVETNASLPESVRLCYDGMQLEMEV